MSLQRIQQVLRNRVVSGSLCYSLLGILTSGMNIILLPFLTRWMSTSEFGVLGIGLAILMVALPLSTLGQGNSVLRFHFEYEKDPGRYRTFFSTIFWFQTGLMLVLALAFALASGAGWSGAFGLPPALLLPILLAVVFNPSRDLANHLFTARQEHVRASVNQFVSFAVATGFSLWLVGGLDMGATGRLYGLAAGAFSAFVMIFFSRQALSQLRFEWSTKELGTALRYGVFFLPYLLAMSGMQAVDRFVLRHFMTDHDVGIYSAAMTLSMGASFISQAMARAWLPRFLQLRGNGDMTGALRGHWTILCLIPLMAVGFAILAPVVHPLLVDSGYEVDPRLFTIMAGASFGFGLFTSQAGYLTYWKKPQWLPVAALPAIVVVAATGWMLVPRFGIAGAATASAAGYLTMCAVLTGVVTKLESGQLRPALMVVISIVLAALGLSATLCIPEAWGLLPRASLAALATFAFAAILWAGKHRIPVMR